VGIGRRSKRKRTNVSDGDKVASVNRSAAQEQRAIGGKRGDFYRVEGVWRIIARVRKAEVSRGECVHFVFQQIDRRARAGRSVVDGRDVERHCSWRGVGINAAV